MKARPILMSAPMVRASLSGQKRMTRRIVKPQPDLRSDDYMSISYSGMTHGGPPAYMLGILAQYGCPYGKKGDVLWVRETWADTADNFDSDFLPSRETLYRADDELRSCDISWKPSIHMHRRRSRLTLVVTDVRVERLHAISETDAISEGTQEPTVRTLPGCHQAAWSERSVFAHLWESINGADSWTANPYVFVIEFAAHQCNVDEFLKQREAA